MRGPSLAQPASINTHEGAERTKYTFVCVRPCGPRQYTSPATSHARSSGGASFALKNIGGAQRTIAPRSVVVQIVDLEQGSQQHDPQKRRDILRGCYSTTFSRFTTSPMPSPRWS